MMPMRIAAGSGLYAAGALVVLISPIYLGAVADSLSLDPAEIGLLAGVEAAGGVFASVTSPYWLNRVRQRAAALAALAIMIVGALATAAMPTFEALVALRLATSIIGAGIVYAIGIAWLADAKSPDRAFAVAGAAQALAPAVLLLTAPMLLAGGGLAALMWASAALFLLAFLFTAMAPDRPVAPRQHNVRAADSAKGPINSRSLALLLSTLALAAAAQSYWAFAERLGDEGAVTPAAIGNELALAAASGVPAALLAAWCVGRFKVGALYLAGSAAFALGLAQLAVAPHTAGYALAAISTFFFSVFLTPFQLGALARIDGESGQSAALAPAAQSLGVVSAPVIAGLFASAASTYLAAVWVAIGFAVLAWTGYALGAVEPSR